MSKIYQEFYCAKSGEGCGGYIMVKINVAINGVVTVICPKCKHRHSRVIEDGHVRECFTSPKYVGQTRYTKTGDEQEIIPTMAAYSATPRTKLYLEGKGKERDCPIVKDKTDLGSVELKASWIEKFGGKV